MHVYDYRRETFDVSVEVMIRSLMIKAAMLAATVGLILWIGWPVPQPHRLDPLPSQGPARGETAWKLSGQRSIEVPRGEEASPSGDTESHVRTHSKLNLNRATLEDLQLLPGVGTILAKRILERREKKGNFHSVDELLEVKGIGKKRLDGIRPLILVATGPERTAAPADEPPRPQRTKEQAS